MKSALNSKLLRRIRFFINGFISRFIIPSSFYQKKLDSQLSSLSNYDQVYILDRVNYYNQLSGSFTLSKDARNIYEMSSQKKSLYYYDLYKVLRYFKKSAKFDYKFGDVSWVEKTPSFVKSRPVSDANQNNVLLKLNHIRHFYPVDDENSYESKKNQIVWRGAAYQNQRKEFLKNFINHPLCNVGQVNRLEEGIPAEWLKSRMSIAEQLEYKFILSIEGNDVATNLKWIAQSNSLCFMPKPKFETWFMEGRLEADFHYVLIKDDFSDLELKIKHYLDHSAEAKEIINNFQEYYKQFENKQREELISIFSGSKVSEVF